MAETKATLKNLKIAPRKVRLVADAIKGMQVNSAIAQLQIMPQRSSGPISKLLKSAISNAKEQKLDENKLVIKSIEVNKGVVLKRAMPRAKGRATLVEKKMSHVTLALEEREDAKAPEYVVQEKQRDEKKKRESRRDEKPKLKPTGTKEKKEEKARSGFRDKIFRRKSV